jgi:death-on-curing protein
MTTKFLSLPLVLQLHDKQLVRFGGASGIRDEGMLESAIAQPKATFEGQFLHPTLFDQAAAYLFHICQNHPFIRRAFNLRALLWG